jgi:hypothetical protein
MLQVWAMWTALKWFPCTANISVCTLLEAPWGLSLTLLVSSNLPIHSKSCFVKESHHG